MDPYYSDWSLCIQTETAGREEVRVHRGGGGKRTTHAHNSSQVLRSSMAHATIFNKLKQKLNFS